MNALELAVIQKIAIDLKHQKLREDPYLKDDDSLKRDCIIEAVCTWWHANTSQYPTEQELRNMEPLMEEVLNLRPRINRFSTTKPKFIG